MITLGSQPASSNEKKYVRLCRASHSFNFSSFTADCHIYVENMKQFMAHKLLLAAASPYFKAVLSTCEPNSPYIVCPEVTSEQMRLLLEYIYTGEVVGSKKLLQEVILVAHDLQIKGLCDISTTNLDRLFEPNYSRSFLPIYVCEAKAKCSLKAPSSRQTVHGTPYSRKPNKSTSNHLLPQAENSAVANGAALSPPIPSLTKVNPDYKFAVDTELNPILMLLLGAIAQVAAFQAAQSVPLPDQPMPEPAVRKPALPEQPKDEPLTLAEFIQKIQQGDDKEDKPNGTGYKKYTIYDIQAAVYCVSLEIHALKAAKFFGVPNRTLYDKVKKLGIITARQKRKLAANGVNIDDIPNNNGAVAELFQIPPAVLTLATGGIAIIEGNRESNWAEIFGNPVAAPLLSVAFLKEIIHGCGKLSQSNNFRAIALVAAAHATIITGNANYLSLDPRVSQLLLFIFQERNGSPPSSSLCDAGKNEVEDLSMNGASSSAKDELNDDANSDEDTGKNEVEDLSMNGTSSSAKEKLNDDTKSHEDDFMGEEE